LEIKIKFYIITSLLYQYHADNTAQPL